MAYTLTFDNSVTSYVNGKPGTSGMKLHNGDTISVSWQYFWLKVNGKDYEGYGETITITDSNINLSEGAYSSDFDAASLTINFVDTSVVRKSVDLTTLAGWEALSSGTHNITIVAKANGFKDSEPSAAVSVEKVLSKPDDLTGTKWRFNFPSQAPDYNNRQIFQINGNVSDGTHEVNSAGIYKYIRCDKTIPFFDAFLTSTVSTGDFHVASYRTGFSGWVYGGYIPSQNIDQYVNFNGNDAILTINDGDDVSNSILINWLWDYGIRIA